MMTLLSVLLRVLITDQTIKLLVRARLGHRSVSLGILGSVRMVQGKIWLMRASRGWSLGTMWIVWLACAGVSSVICAMAADFGLSFGLLLGGGVSHAIETSLRGSICDYVCLRFWPAFNLADLALGAGAIGLVIKVADGHYAPPKKRLLACEPIAWYSRRRNSLAPSRYRAIKKFLRPILRRGACQ